VIVENSSTARARHEIIAIPIAMNSRPRAKVCKRHTVRFSGPRERHYNYKLRHAKL
jgi:hypothetical protein